jgi:hypothetical protein
MGFEPGSEMVTGDLEVVNCFTYKRVAERVGFEPTVVQRATTVFETAPINHSGTSPFGWVL